MSAAAITTPPGCPPQEIWDPRRRRALADISVAAGKADRSGELPYGWTPDDLAWERCQQEGALAWRAGDPSTAAERWTDALEIADRFFGRGDPRIAASLASQAPILRRRNRPHQAQRVLGYALLVWDDAWRWVQLMRRQRPGAGASAAGYGHAEMAVFMRLIGVGRAATVALERQASPAVQGLDLWLRLRPHRLTDLRKLLAATLLIAPDPE